MTDMDRVMELEKVIKSLQQENQSLKQTITEQGEKINSLRRLGNQEWSQRQEYENLKQLQKRIEEASKPENVFDIVHQELIPITERKQNHIDITNWVLDLLQQLLKGDKE